MKKAVKLDFAYWQAKARFLSSAVNTYIQHHNPLTPGAEGLYMQCLPPQQPTGPEGCRAAPSLPSGWGWVPGTQHLCSSHGVFVQAPIGRGVNVKIFIATEMLTLFFAFFLMSY